MPWQHARLAKLVPEMGISADLSESQVTFFVYLSLQVVDAFVLRLGVICGIEGGSLHVSLHPLGFRFLF